MVAVFAIEREIRKLLLQVLTASSQLLFVTIDLVPVRRTGLVLRPRGPRNPVDPKVFEAIRLGRRATGRTKEAL
jgi:hypothetical protein